VTIIDGCTKGKFEIVLRVCEKKHEGGRRREEKGGGKREEREGQIVDCQDFLFSQREGGDQGKKKEGERVERGTRLSIHKRWRSKENEGRRRRTEGGARGIPILISP
jgi:hypothetical protein